MGEGLWFKYPQSSHIKASLADRTPFWLKRLFFLCFLLSASSQFMV